MLAGLLLTLVALAGCAQPIALPSGLNLPAAQATEAAAAAADAPVAETAATTATAALPMPTETHNGIPVGFTAEGFPFRGDPNAPVTMIEYSDFQCPFCSRYFVQTEPALNEAYVQDGKLQVIFRDFPIVELHPNAPAAHIASLCVAEQGAALYWEIHDQLFRTQSEWSNSTDPAPVFERLAEEAGVDMTAYKACMEDANCATGPDRRRHRRGPGAGISGTPSFQFVGSAGDKYLLVGAQPFEQFAAYVDALAAGEKPPVALKSSPKVQPRFPSGLPPKAGSLTRNGQATTWRAINTGAARMPR